MSHQPKTSAHRQTPIAQTASGNGRVLAGLADIVKIYTIPGSPVEIPAIRGVSIEVKEGEYVAICGHSGSGKSTLLNLLGCLDHPTSGRYTLGGLDVSKLDDNALSEIRSQRLGFVFQSFNLIPQLTLLENLEVPLIYQGISPILRRQRALEFIERVELSDRINHRPMELSGGQQQRVAIARAMVNDPLLILADEPTGNLDTATGEIILKLFDQLHNEGKTIILITHERSVAEHCRRIITLRDGYVIEDIDTRSNTSKP
ncbi:MAG: ABC transporter ATP-binding protein [Planctomycetota bacterium]|nr:MAG: ABC transporter ATP-binding protein [Planctomycetota bacterium]